MKKRIHHNLNLKKKLYALGVVFVLVVFLLPYSLDAILDGRTTPIYLDSVYTFTQGEWARGSVFFRQGFDLPIGGTAYLSIDSGFVNGPINLNGGTLILQSHLILKNRGIIVAPGFMRGTNGFPSSVFLKYEGRELWGGVGKIKFITTSMVFHAISENAAMDNKNVIIDIREGGNIYFRGGRVTLRNWLTSNTRPPQIWFTNTDVVVTNDFSTFNSPEFYFQDTVSLTTLHPITLKQVNVYGGSKLTVYPGSKLIVNQINIAFPGTRFEMRLSSLDFVSTSSAFIRIIEPLSHNLQGSLAFEGKCQLSSSTNNELVFDEYATLEIFSGAQFELKQGTHLII